MKILKLNFNETTGEITVVEKFNWSEIISHEA